MLLLPAQSAHLPNLFIAFYKCPTSRSGDYSRKLMEVPKHNVQERQNPTVAGIYEQLTACNVINNESLSPFYRQETKATGNMKKDIITTSFKVAALAG